MSFFRPQTQNRLRIALISATTPTWESDSISAVAISLAKFDVKVEVITDPGGLSRVLGELKNPKSVRMALEATRELVIRDSDFPLQTIPGILASLFRSREPTYPVIITEVPLFKSQFVPRSSESDLEIERKLSVSVLGGFRRGVVVSSSRSKDVHDPTVRARSFEVALRRGIGYLLGGYLQPKIVQKIDVLCMIQT